MKEEEIKNEALQDDTFYYTLDEAVTALEDYKRKGMNVYITFREEKLYSLLDDRDSCYKKITGENYETYTKHLEEEQRKRKIERLQEEIEALEKVPEYIARGEAVIYPQQKKDWKTCVYAKVSDLYVGKDLENALEIMESLAKDGDMEKAYKIYRDANHSGMSGSSVRNIVVSFSENGTRFYRYNAMKNGMTLSEEDEKELKKIDEKFQSYQNEKEDL